MPSPNIPLMIAFFFIAICNPQSTGMGKITTVMSNNRLNIPKYKLRAFWSPHVRPVFQYSQLADIGVQMRKTDKMMVAKKAVLKP